MINRRALLRMAGLGAASMPTMTPKRAAAVLGVSRDMGIEPMSDQPTTMAGVGGRGLSYYGSKVQIGLEARRDAKYSAMHGKPYPHMKSWGHGFRHMVLERDIFLEKLMEERLRDDEQLLKKVLAGMGFSERG